MRGRKHAEDLQLFAVALRRQPLRKQRERPDMVFGRMRRPDALRKRAFIIVAVFSRKDMPARVAIDRVARASVTEIRYRQQRGQVRIVRDKGVARPVRLIRVQHPAVAVRHGGASRQPALHAFGKRRTARRKLRLCNDFGKDAPQEPHDGDDEHVRRDQIAVSVPVVARAEGGPDQPVLFAIPALAAVLEAVLRVFPFAQEGIVRARRMVLFRFEHPQHGAHRFAEALVEHRRVPAVFIVLLRKPHRIAETVDLEFPLPDPIVAQRYILVPAPVRLFVERVRVRVDPDVKELPAQHAPDERAHVLVDAAQPRVHLHLRGRVAQPHGGDVPRGDIDAPVPLLLHRRRERTQETASEQFRQLCVFDGGALFIQPSVQFCVFHACSFSRRYLAIRA